MKVVQFTIPVAKDYSVMVQEELLPYFYTHLHRHTETQLTWIIRGEGTLIAANHMQPFKAGEVYIIGANQPHVFKTDPSYFIKRNKKSVHSLTLFFNPQGNFEPILNLPENKSIKKWMESSLSGLQVPSARVKQVTDHMLLVKKSRQGYRLASFIHLLQLLSEMKNWKKLNTSLADFRFSDTEGLRMNTILQYTLSHSHKNISLAQIAKIACMTPPAFCRYFKKHTRKTYFDFLNEIRVTEACRKLLAGQYESVASIAYETGFNSAAGFNRVFKKVTGVAPLQYYKEWMQKSDQ